MSDYEPGDTLVEALRRANPVPAAQTEGRRALPSAHATFADIITHRSRRVRTRVLVIAIAIVLVALSLMAFVLERRQGRSLVIYPVCYSAADLHAPKVVAFSEDPQSGCAQVWLNKGFGRGAAVPNFDVCVLPSGVLAVFPGESGSVCSRLDLPESSGDNRIGRFVDAVNDQISASCLSREQAEAIINGQLAERGLSGWTITARPGFDATRPCASVGFDPVKKTIFVTPLANPFVPPPPSTEP